MRDVQAVLRPWSSHAWRAALASTAVTLPLHVLPAGAGAASSGQPLQQPPQAQIASALDLAAHNALPPGYPRLYGVPSVPAVLLKAIAWEESNWRQFQAPDVPLASPSGGYGVMQLTDGIGGEPVSATVQSAIANNFVYNIACGARLLSMKWATTPRIGTGDPTVLENWYYAVWAYNNWGWRNNPLNPVFTRVGTPISNPGAFPYQERVFYLISHPPRDAIGRPLWAAVPVTLPDQRAIGTVPHALPAPQVPHDDIASHDAPLPLSNVDDAAFRGDLTLPDGTSVAPGTPLHKVWLLRNTGGTFWSGYSWRFVGGDRMAAPLSTTVPFVPPLADVALGVDMVAPQQTGTYRGYWQLFNAAGQPIGPRAWASAVVASASVPPVVATATPVPTAVISPTVSGGPAVVHMARHLSPGSADNAAYVADVTIPDGTVLAPGQRFTKTWAIQNTGTSTWDSRYHWQFEAGAPLGTVRAVTAPIVPPGATALFSVEMVAPQQPGSYRGFWQMTDPSGAVFGHQAWVLVHVEAGSRATLTPPATWAAPTAALRAASGPTATAQPSAMPPPAQQVMTATVAPSSPVVTATLTPSLPPTATTPQPAPPPAAPTPRPTRVPWFGQAVSRAFFAEGYTGAGYHEYLSLLNPRPRVLRAALTIYRADGATRGLGLRLAPLSRRTLDVNVLAPQVSTALKVEMDAPAVVERALYAGNGQMVAGAPRPSRRWYVAEAYVGAGFRDALRIFNPSDLAATVTITAYRGDGSVRLAHRVVAAGTRLNVALNDMAPHGASGLQIRSSEPTVVESVVNAPHASGPSSAMALVSPSRLWLFPDGGTSRGNREYIAVLNPGSTPATVRLHPVTADGYARPLRLRVGPHARAVLVVHALTHQAGMAAVITSDRPIVAQEIRYARSGAMTVVNGAPAPARAWGLAEGYTGGGFKQWITLLNPGAQAATVTVRLIGPHGKVRVVKLRERPHHRDYLFVTPLRHPGPVAAVVTANRPIVAGRTMIFNAGSGLSTTIGVAISV